MKGSNARTNRFKFCAVAVKWHWSHTFYNRRSRARRKGICRLMLGEERLDSVARPAGAKPNPMDHRYPGACVHPPSVGARS
jgi:hypothetical protein